MQDNHSKKIFFTCDSHKIELGSFYEYYETMSFKSYILLMQLYKNFMCYTGLSFEFQYFKLNIIKIQGFLN